jgi:hypothetical protein
MLLVAESHFGTSLLAGADAVHDSPRTFATVGAGYDPVRSPLAAPVAVVVVPSTRTIGLLSSTVIEFTTGETVTVKALMARRCCSG